jgi:hypothetical protein
LESQWDSWNPPLNSLKERLKDHKHFVPAFGVFASAKPLEPIGLLASIKGKIESELCLKFGEGRVSLSKFFLTNKEKGIACGKFNSLPLIIKFPFSSTGEKGEQQNLELLEHSYQKQWNDLLKCPKPLVYGAENNQRFFVEQSIQGKLLFYFDWASIRQFYHPVRQLLVEWDQQLASHGRLLTNDWYRRQVTGPLENLKSFIQVEGVFQKVQSYFEKHLMGANLICGLRHGDLSISNVFVEKQRISGIIDWEQYDFEGIPFFNAIDFLGRAKRGGHESRCLEDVLKDILGGKFSCAEEQVFFEECCQRWDVHLGMQEALLFLYWIQYVNGQLSHGLEYDEVRLSQTIRPMLHELAAR